MMKKVLSWMLTVILLFGALALAAPVAFAEEEFEDEFEEDFEDPFADFDKWDGVTYDTSPFAGIDADNLGNNCTKPGGGAVVIDTAAKLAGLAKAVNDAAMGNGSYGAYKNLPIYITKNIDLQGHKFPSIGKDYAVAMFSGCLEGRLNGETGKAATIANLYVPDQSSNNSGFVGTLRGGAVKNLTFVNAVVGNEGNYGSQGVAVGYVSKNAEVSGITVIDSTLIASGNSSSGTVVSDGIVVGTVKTDSSINLKDLAAINCVVTCPTGMDSPVGGVVGIVQNKSGVTYTLENCYFSGMLLNANENFILEDLWSDIPFGGILGQMPDASTVTLKNCHSNGYVISGMEDSGCEYPFGAFVGVVSSGGKLTLENCLDTGEISAYNGKIGMIGSASGSLTLSVSNCYSLEAEAVTIGLNRSTATNAVDVEVVEFAALLGEAAKATLVGFDFSAENGDWKTAEDSFPSPVGVEDELWLLHEHWYISFEQDNAEQHTATCVCGASISEQHYNEYESDGAESHLATCYLCGATGLEAHAWEETLVTHPTEEEVSAGETEVLQDYICEHCEETKTEASTTHLFDDGVVVTPATHLTVGVMKLTCSCGEYSVNCEIPKLTEHTYQINRYNAGQHQKACACGETVYEDHIWDAGEVLTAPTSETVGVRIYTCACGETKNETIDKLPPHEHSFSAVGRYNATQHQKSCSCGYALYQDHTWDDGAVIVASTATQKGTKAFTCTTCAEKRYEELPLPEGDSNVQASQSAFGCFGVISGGTGLIALITFAGACVLTKKKED